MDDFFRMDVFFVITTVFIIILGVLLSMALYRVIRILKDVEHVSENISKESDLIQEDVAHLRAHVRKEGFRLAHLFSFFRSLVKRHSSKKKNSKE